MVKGTCELCGADFFVRFPSQLRHRRFCGRECAAVVRADGMRRKDRRCERCGAMYSPRSFAQRFCSVACGTKATAGTRKPRETESRLRDCDFCGQAYDHILGYKSQRFCSRACASRSTAQQRAEVLRYLEDRTCKGCAKVFRPVTDRQRFCSRSCYLTNGCSGRYITAEGYVRIRVPAGTPGAQVSNKGQAWRMLEHRYVMQQAIDRPLESQETVHHINGDKADNRLENLQLRTGRHGKGVVMACLDCGSHNLGPVPISGA